MRVPLSLLGSGPARLDREANAGGVDAEGLRDGSHGGASRVGDLTTHQLAQSGTADLGLLGERAEGPTLLVESGGDKRPQGLGLVGLGHSAAQVAESFCENKEPLLDSVSKSGDKCDMAKGNLGHSVKPPTVGFLAEDDGRGGPEPQGTNPMTNATVPAVSEQLTVARELLPLFSRMGVRGTPATREAARLDLIAAIDSTDADQADHLHDAIHEARYFLGLVCLECGELIPDDVDSTDYCSRTCYQEGGL